MCSSRLAACIVWPYEPGQSGIGEQDKDFIPIRQTGSRHGVIQHKKGEAGTAADFENLNAPFLAKALKRVIVDTLTRRQPDQKLLHQNPRSNS
jgi:hypothetical protein